MKGICSLCHEEYDLTGYDFEEVDPKDYVCGGCDCDANRWQYKPWNFTLKLYFDGGCRPNPGKMVICSVLIEDWILWKTACILASEQIILLISSPYIWS